MLNLDSCIHYLARAGAIWQSSNLWQTSWKKTAKNSLLMVESYLEWGPQYIKEAEENLQNSLEWLLLGLGESQDELRWCYRMAEFYIDEGRYNKANEYLRLSLQTCQTLLLKHDEKIYTSLNEKLELGVLLKEYMEKIYRLYYHLDIILKDKDAALQHFMLATDWRDSVSNDQAWKKVSMIQGDYETEISQNQITILEKDNEVKGLRIKQSRTYLLMMGGFVFIIAFMAFLFLRQNKIRADQKAINLEQKLFRLQMNPHFIFNSLSGILVLIKKKDLDHAVQYLTSFSRLLRSTLKGSREDYILLEEEVEGMQNYLNLQSLMYMDKLTYSIEVDEAIDLENAIIPPMLIQPFVENAVIHGIKHKEEKGHVNLSFQLEDSRLICEVDDDGVGRQKAREIESQSQKKHQSMATDIVQDRIQVLNKKLKQRIKFEIIDKHSESMESQGTRVLIEMPYLHE